MRTKHQEKEDWTCKICKKENLQTLFFVCPACMEDVRRNCNHKEKKEQDD